MKQATILDEIVAYKLDEVKIRQRKLPLSALQTQCEAAPSLRGFAAALADAKPAIIAEIKKASPSKGVIRESFEPREIATRYQDHGATCLSVLTDKHFFQGCEQALTEARAAVQLPVLRKDFILTEYQVFETRVLVADCLLLIVAALDRQQFIDLHQTARELNLDVLVEIHDEQELGIALEAKPNLIGINNRNLKTFETTIQTTLELAPKVPDDIQVVSESGIHTSEHVATLQAGGVNSFLVGEAFMKAPDPGIALAEMFEDA